MRKLSLVVLIGLVLLTLPVAAQQSQGKEIELKTLGRAPLAPYLQTEEEVRIVLKKYNEEIGKALEYFPGGALGEIVYLKLYENVDSFVMQLQQIPVGQKMDWMIYRNGGLLKNVRWAGNSSFDAFVFEVEAEGKLFQFAVPIRCGNVSLISMKEIPISAPVVQPQPQPQPKAEQPFVPPAVIQAPAPTPAPALSAPIKAQKRWSPTVKFKVGSGWAKTSMPANQNLEGRVDFFTLIPDEMSLFYCEDGTAAWLYSPTKDIPFTLGEQIGLHTQLQNTSIRKYQPFFAGLELEIAKNFFVTADYFHIGKFHLQEYSLSNLMSVTELRLLGEYDSTSGSADGCTPTYVYYIGLERQRREQLIQQDIRIEEWSVGVKFELKLAKKFYVAPAAGVTWQEQRGTREVTEAVTKMYPFKEEALEPQQVVSSAEKIKTSVAHPYVGASVELYCFQVEARYLMKKFNEEVYTSPWRVQGALVLRF
ncbi:MAG: hypothetical protein WC579_02300 [Candidatus Paceibacterota bacterium]|nr:hypothetical protein [Candidatus Paceibacterota bacterium]